MKVTTVNQTISSHIANLEAIKQQYGDLPICSEGNEAKETTIYLTPLKDDSTSPRHDEAATKLFLDIY